MMILPATAHEDVGGDIEAIWVDSWMEEQPELPNPNNKLIQFNYDNVGTDSYHLGDEDVAVYITLANSDVADAIYVDQATLSSNHALFTVNQSSDNGHTIPSSGWWTFMFTIDIGTSGAVNTLYHDALRLSLRDMEQPPTTPISDETFDFDIYVSSVFDDDSPDTDMDVHEDLPHIIETDAYPEFEEGISLQEGEIPLKNHAGYSIYDIAATVSSFPPEITPSEGNDTSFNTGPITGNGGDLSLFWNFDVAADSAPGFYGANLAILYVRDDTGETIIEAARPTGLYVAPTTTATGPTGGPINYPGVTIEYDMTGSPSTVDLYYTTNTTSPYTWTFVGTDATADGSYNWTLPTDGSYGWFAISDNETAPLSDSPPEASYYIYDGTPPGVQSTDPIHASIDVSIDKEIEITFNESMNPASLSHTIEPDPGDLDEGWGSSDTILSISHLDFASSTRYWVNLTQITDLAGNNLSSLPFSFYFDSIYIPSNATVSGPVGGPFRKSGITITYTTTEDPAIVELYYTMDTSSPYSWTLIGEDSTVNGSYWWTCPSDGYYGWIAVTPDETIPTSSDPPEAAFYHYDGTRPKVVRTTPSNVEIEVSLNEDILISFNETMDSSSISYTLEPNPGGLMHSWIDSGLTLMISHEDLSPNSKYWVNITTASDLADNDLNPIPFSFYFDTITMDLTPPEVVSVSPSGSNILTTSNITIIFSEGMNISTVEDAFSYSDGTSIFGVAQGTSIWNTENDTFTFISSNPLNYSTRYVILISTDAKDMANNTLLHFFSWSFNTKVAPDNVAPTVSSVSHIGQNAEITDSITIMFSKAMNKTKVEESLTITGGAQIKNFSWVGNTLTITFTKDLEYDTEYTVTIGTQAEDEAGNPLEEPYTWTFTTKEEEEEPTTDPFLWILLAIIIVVIVLILFFIFKRGKTKEIPHEEPKAESEVTTTKDDIAPPPSP